MNRDIAELSNNHLDKRSLEHGPGSIDNFFGAAVCVYEFAVRPIRDLITFTCPETTRMGKVASGLTRGLAVWAMIWITGCQPAPPKSAPPLPKVSVITLKARPFPITTELPGRVVAYRISDVRPQVNGVILKRLFTEGSEVKIGQQLYQIDSAPYKATYDSATAAAATAAALAGRYKALAAANAVSRQDYDNAIAADLQARATVETARINLVYTKVLSPISGRISRSAVTEGALVTANQPAALATVQQLDPIYVDVTQPSSILLRLRRDAGTGLLQQNMAGQAAVRLRLEDGSNYTEPGALEFSEVTVDEGTGSVTLRALFPNPQRLLLPGMFVHEVIEEGVQRNALLVPQVGISHNQKGEPTALVVGPNNAVQLRVLSADRAIGDQWLVTSGLNPGDRVIVEGVQAAVPGTKVEPEELRSGGNSTQRAPQKGPNGKSN